MKFSIILPVRNGGQYMKDCVHSILSQSLQDFNLIVLDNCSSDGGLKWLYSLNDNRIVVHESDKSLTIEENWSRIKDVPKNEFITLIGHDDLLNVNYLETMNDLISKHPGASLYQAHFQFIDKDGLLIRDCLTMDEVQYAHDFIASVMCRNIDSTGTGYMMRSKDYDIIQGINPAYDNLIFADYALWIEMILLGYKATSINIAFKYRVHQSVSRITNGEKYALAFEKFLIFLKELRDKNEKIKIVIEKYGKTMLLFYCESISHLLLKTPGKNRKTSVNDFIVICKKYSALLFPDVKFNPEKIFRINIAKKLDNTFGGRVFFNGLNRILKKL